MTEDSKPKNISDDFEKLLDLIKEGASYLLHVFLYFASKTVPAEIIEKLLNHHINNSSFDYYKDGKTYIYRLFSCIYEVEKHIVAMALQYIYSYIPLPLIKSIYENFCVNNNLECIDVKLKKCKEALINSSRRKKNEEKNTKVKHENEDPVSRPRPYDPINPNLESDTSADSEAPVPKLINPSVDFGKTLQQQIEQNNAAIQKNLDDFGKSISNVFSGGLNAPTPGSSSNS